MKQMKTDDNEGKGHGVSWHGCDDVGLLVGPWLRHGTVGRMVWDPTTMSSANSWEPKPGIHAFISPSPRCQLKNWPTATAVLCLLGATACLFEAGDRIELVRVSSPGGRLDAVVTLTPGSAISRPTAQVSIVPADAPVTSFGNVYVAGSDLSLQPVWRADDSLLVIASNNLDGGPVQQEVEGVAVAVLALTSIDDTASEARAFSTLQLKATAQCVIQLWRDGWNAESLFALPYPPLDHEQGRRLHYLAQDAWGEKLMLTVKGDSFTVASAGADGRPDTEDDLGLTFRR